MGWRTDAARDATGGSISDADEMVAYVYDAFGRQIKVVQDRDGNLTTIAVTLPEILAPETR